jgi:uncharacterized protein (TIGR02099 family)
MSGSIDLSLLPSTPLKTWSALTRALLLLVSLVWLLFGATWGTLHWVIVPRIGEFRPQLEAYASKSLGLAVQVDSITAQSDGLVPSFELTGVALFDAKGNRALSLPRVLVALSPSSVWRLGFEQLYIDQPKLDIRRSADGLIRIAGLEFSSTAGANSQALNWFFSQREVVVHQGTVRWTDELRQTEPVVLQQVDGVVRNIGRHHDVRLDATPPPVWGDRFGVRGQFLQPLLSRQNGQWQDWQGQFFAAFERVDLSELRRFVDLGFDLSQGKGAVRVWVDVSQGQVTGATADTALTEVTVTLGQDLQALALLQVQGRLGVRMLAGGFELFARALAFDVPDGQHWSVGNVRVLSVDAQGGSAARGELQADRLDLAALAQIASHLPLSKSLREQLVHYGPKGIIENLNATWHGPVTMPDQYTAKGSLRQLELAAVGAVPGVRGLDLDLEFDQQAGRAKVLLANGSVSVPDIFETPEIAIDQLSGQVTWQNTADRITVDLSNLKFSNADAQGQAQIKWQTSDPATSSNHSRFPGVLDLQGSLSRGDGTRVYRYLPLVLDKAARDYVRDAVQAGSVSNVRFVVQGEIDKIPSRDVRQGTFKISADVSGGRLAYVPPRLQDAGELPWPSVLDLSGQLIFDRLQLQVKGARGRLGEGTALQLTRVDASIADLTAAQVVVTADMKGPLRETLRVVNGSPLSAMTGQALARTVASGNADYKLKLDLPIADMGKSTVQGSVTLGGNDVQMTPDTPKFARAHGVVNYSHTGFNLAGVQVRLLGGDARMEGGLVLASGGGTPVGTRSLPTVIRVTGSASAEGLRQATELGFVSRLARQMGGSASYNATLGWYQGMPELLVTSDLQGLSSMLPIPLRKEPQSRIPLRVQTTSLARESVGTSVTASLTDRLSLNLDGVARMVFERDVSTTDPRVLRGSVAVGADTLDLLALPAQGVVANLNLAQFNVDAWGDVLAQVTGATQVQNAAPMVGVGNPYLPNVLAVRADALVLGGRVFNHIVMGAHRDGLQWRGNVNAAELNGYLEYRPAVDAAAPGRVYARLVRLTMAQSTATDVEALLDSQPASIPALDIVVDDFELRGKHLGRLEVDAINRSAFAAGGSPEAREWRLNKLNLILPEATLMASGNWIRLNEQSSAPTTRLKPGLAEPRRTVLNFKLDMADGGKLLTRFGMKDVVRQASGKMEGQVAWIGSPLKPDYPTLGGAFTVNVAAGQFLKADPGLAKLLGVLSLQALPRRLTLDFRDVFSEGFAFDFLRGDVHVNQGIARTNNLQMKGVNAAVLMEGAADIAHETQDLKVVVVPEINAGTASLIASVINPAVGLGTFLAQWLLRRPLMDSATQEFHIDGSWADPQVRKIESVNTVIKESKP